MKYVFFTLYASIIITSSCMEEAVHSTNKSKPLYNYCFTIGRLNPNAITLPEALNLYKFLDARAQNDPLILTLTAQQLSERCLDDVYMILHGQVLDRASIPTHKAKKQLIEESARSIEALLGHLSQYAQNSTDS